MEEKIKAIYYIKDLRNDKIIYIGQTIDYEYRKKYHFYNKTTPIDLYMFKEGRNNFLIEMFTDIDCINLSNEERKVKEDELIVYYNTINDGFNKQRSGNSFNKNEYEKNYQKSEKWKKHLQNYYQMNKEYIKERSKEYYKKKCKKSDAQTTL